MPVEYVSTMRVVVWAGVNELKENVQRGRDD